jgi:hypothetical protein
MTKIWEAGRLFRQSKLNDEFVGFMKSSTENYHDKDSSEKDMSLNFAITLIVAISSILYKSYNYFQNNAVDIRFFGLISIVTSLCVTVLLFLLLFVFSKGFSIEIKSLISRKNMNLLASTFYQLSFITFAVLFIVGIGAYSAYFFIEDQHHQEMLINITGITIICLFLILRIQGYSFGFKLSLKYKLVYCLLLLLELLIINAFFISDDTYKRLLIAPFLLFIISYWSRKYDDFLSKHSNLKYSKSWRDRVIYKFCYALEDMDVYFLICFLSVFAFVIIFGIVSPVLVSQSHISIEMDDVYDINETIIHCSLRIFGVNENIGLSLSTIDTNTTTRVEYLVIEPSPHPMSNGSILFCNYLNNGKYSIHLDMSNQSSGYYKLSTQTGDNIKQAVKVFYLK